MENLIKVRRGDHRYSNLIQGFNRRWLASNCEVIYLCKNSQGVVEALGEATAAHGSAFSIKGGGHCYENFVFNPEVKAIIDVSLMDGVGQDADLGYYAEAGGTNWRLYKELYRQFGMTIPAGSCYSVGLGGHICGGGYGLLSRLHGLTIDHLTGVEIVTMRNGAPECRTVTRHSEGDDFDLFWANTGGGGGNFGVITKYYFETLPKAPNFALLNTAAIEWSEITSSWKLQAVLDVFADFAASAPGEVFSICKLSHEAAGQIGFITQVVYDDPSSEKDLFKHIVRPFLENLEKVVPLSKIRIPFHGHPVTTLLPMDEQTQQLTWYEAAQTLNGSGSNQRGKYKSAYMRKRFPEHQTEALYRYLKMTVEEIAATADLDRFPTGLSRAQLVKAVKDEAPAISFAQSLCQIDSYGGRINEVAPGATAIPQRDSIMKLQYQTYWQHYVEDSPEQNDIRDLIHRAWIYEMYAAVYAETGGAPNPALDPTGTVDGCYYNYPDTDLMSILGLSLDETLTLYFKENFEECPDRNLRRVKRTWDPENYFRHQMSIPV